MNGASVAKMREWAHSVAVFAADNFGFVPDPWQAEAFLAWDRGDQRLALQACKGPGKTAFLAVLMWHFLATRPYPKIAATSITGDNLVDGLWTELAKWRIQSAFLTAAFEWQKTRVVCKDSPETWWASARTWSRTASAEQQGATLAGLHADYILFVIDEGGDVPVAILNAAEAALASGIECRILMAGNPITIDGALGQACLRDRHLWTVIEISGAPDDPKRSPRIDIEWARNQIKSYGRDNPWVQANVFGRFSSSAPMTFIGRDVVEAATKREPTAGISDPLCMGCDVARFGDDESGIWYRKGRDARTLFNPQDWVRNIDTMQFATLITNRASAMRADGVFIDGTGVGGGVVDRCRQLRLANTYEVQFGGKADRGGLQEGERGIAYGNKVAEMWGQMRDWLKVGAIPDDQQLVLQLTSRRYFFQTVDGNDQIVLEPKKEMKKRGLPSPDRADALALTFAYPVQPHAHASMGYGAARQHVVHEYDPLEAN